nr:copia-like retroelement Pol polyprotein [Tanacetum cinerariifolium]
MRVVRGVSPKQLSEIVAFVVFESPLPSVSGYGADRYDSVDIMMADYDGGNILLDDGRKCHVRGTVTRKTLKGRKQLGEYQSVWKIKTGNVLDSCNQRKCSDDNDVYYWEYTPAMRLHMMALSTTEAVYMTLTEAAKEAIWLKRLTIESGFELKIVAGIATRALSKAVPGSRLQLELKLLRIKDF